MLTRPQSAHSAIVAEPLPTSDDDQPPASSPRDAGGTLLQNKDADDEIHRQLAALGAENMAGIMTAQLVMRHMLPPKTMHDAWADFMRSYRELFHTLGYSAADAFGHREATRLLGEHWTEALSNE